MNIFLSKRALLLVLLATAASLFILEINSNPLLFKLNTQSREARRIAYGSYSAARNLGISLSNDGVVEFRQGREETALLCLKESSLIYQYGKTFAFLGDIYYKEGERLRHIS